MKCQHCLMPTRNVTDRLRDGDVLLMDGGTGSEIQRRGVDVLLGSQGDRLGPWSATANVDAADVVQQVHQDYLRVGADVIISNNFRTTKSRLEPVGLGDRWQEYSHAATVNAVKARDAMNPKAYVAGGMAGLGLEMLGVGEGTDVQIMGRDAYHEEFAEHAKIMADAGADIILAEYMGYIEDCVEAVDASAEAGLPVWLGVRHVGLNRQMQYRETFKDLADALNGHPVDAVFLMCSSAENISDCLPILQDAYDGPIGVYPNTGYNPMAMVGGRTRMGPDIISAKSISPSRLAEYAGEWREMGAQIIGGCCATGPEHIMGMRDVVKSR